MLYEVITLDDFLSAVPIKFQGFEKLWWNLLKDLKVAGIFMHVHECPDSLFRSTIGGNFVITSYSIHYTKLYEKTLSLFMVYCENFYLNTSLKTLPSS